VVGFTTGLRRKVPGKIFIIITTTTIIIIIIMKLRSVGTKMGSGTYTSYVHGAKKSLQTPRS
jgi:hypothetical protein